MKCRYFDTDNLTSTLDAVERFRLARLEEMVENPNFTDPMVLAACSELIHTLTRDEGIAFTALCISGRMLDHAWNQCFPDRPKLILEASNKTPRIIVDEMLSVLEELDYYDFIRSKHGAGQGAGDFDKPLSARFSPKRFAFKDSNEVREFDLQLDYANRPFDMHEDILLRANNMRQMIELAIYRISISEDLLNDLDYILN